MANTKGKGKGKASTSQGRSTGGVQIRERGRPSRRDPIPPPLPPSYDLPQGTRDYSSKRIWPGKRLIRNEIQQLNMLEFYSANGWMELMELEEPCYKQLIVEFYENLSWTRLYGKVQTKVGGVSFELTEEDLRNIFNIPLHEHQYPIFAFKDFAQLIDGVGQRNIYAFLQDVNESQGRWFPLLQEVRPIYKAHIKVFRHNVVPRDVHDGNITIAEATCLFYLFNDIRVNLPETILAFMKNVVIRSTCLPFGMALTRIFRCKGIILDGVTKMPFNHMWNLNLATLKHMALFYYRGYWMHKEEHNALPADVRALIDQRIQAKTTFEFPLEDNLGALEGDQDMDDVDSLNVYDSYDEREDMEGGEEEEEENEQEDDFDKEQDQ